MTATLGIDLSVDPARTAACRIIWEQGGIGRVDRLLVGSRDPHALSDGELVSMIGEADLTGIDAPFGWPVGFVDAVRGWTESKQWRAGRELEALRYRATDLRVPGPRRPLSVSTDLIGVTAMRCASILDALGPEVDRSGTSGPVVEVYPAAALRRWGLTSTGYKGGADSEVRRRLVADLRGKLAGVCEIDDPAMRTCGQSHDALDSVVAALAVRARMLGRTTPPEGPEEIELARTEGWIHVPDCEPGDLAG